MQRVLHLKRLLQRVVRGYLLCRTQKKVLLTMVWKTTQARASAQVKEVVLARKQRALVPRGPNTEPWLTAISGKVADRRMACIKTLARADRDAKVL